MYFRLGLGTTPILRGEKLGVKSLQYTDIEGPRPQSTNITRHTNVEDFDSLIGA